MDQKRDLEGFASGPVFTLVLRNAIPAMAAMLMVLIYNLADTFLLVRPMMRSRWQRYRWQRLGF